MTTVLVAAEKRFLVATVCAALAACDTTVKLPGTPISTATAQRCSLTVIDTRPDPTELTSNKFAQSVDPPVADAIHAAACQDPTIFDGKGVVRFTVTDFECHINDRFMAGVNIRIDLRGRLEGGERAPVELRATSAVTTNPLWGTLPSKCRDAAVNVPAQMAAKIRDAVGVVK